MDKCKVTVGQIKPNMMSSFWDGWWWQVIRKHPKVAAINLDCWGASFDISFFNLLFFSPFYFLMWHYVHLALLVSLTCVSLSQKVSFEWCYSVCCPLFSVCSNPTRGGWSPLLSLILPEVSSCEKGVVSLHSRLMHAQDGSLDRREVSVQSVGFLS